MCFPFSFFDTLNEIVYVADASSYALVYMNNIALQLYGLPSLEAVRGKPCYTVLHNRSVPCADCNISQLHLGEFYECRTFNAALTRYLSSKSTLLQHEGQLLRFELAINVSNEEELQSANFVFSLREEILNRGITKALAESNYNNAINTMLSYLGEHFQSERAYIFEPDGELWNNTYEWCAAGVTPQIENLQGVPFEVMEGWLNSFAQGKHIIIEDLEATKDEDPHMYATLKPQGIHSLVVVPVLEQKRPLAFFGLDNPPRKNLQNISDFLSITACFFDNLLTRRDSMQRLEKTVALRTKELEESKQDALAASQAKSTFLSTISHEIRTPMNAILGFIHLFNRENLTAEQTAQLDKIQASSNMLLNLINDVLDISKIESGRLQLEQRTFPLQQCIEPPRDIATSLASSKHIDFIVSIAQNLPKYIEGDSQRISQVLLNILNNAIKFTPAGHVSFSVAARDPIATDETVPENMPIPTDKDGRIVLGFHIQDTGIGIEEDHLRSIFEPFTQADNSITRRFGGTGLGLSICKKLTESMGGDIKVTSTIGQGSSFDITLRVYAKDTLQQDVPAYTPQKQVSLSNACEKLKGKRILLVEDNLINQEISTAMLQQYDIDVVTADNGKEAVDLLAKDTRFDGIFMDMQMPVMDGVEATQRIRAMGRKALHNNTPELEYLAHIPIIALTANAMQEDRGSCLEAGMDDHISKPIKPVLLTQCLLRWFTASQGTNTRA